MTRAEKRKAFLAAVKSRGMIEVTIGGRTCTFLPMSEEDGNGLYETLRNLLILSVENDEDTDVRNDAVDCIKRNAKTVME